jgi:hypothetical protein
MPEQAKKSDLNLVPATDPLLPWIQRAGALAVALTSWIAAFLPIYPGLARPIAYSLAAIITVASAVWFYRSRPRVAAKPFPSTPLTEDTQLRGLLPFEDGDELIGRQADLADMMTILRSDGFKFGVNWGQSGCGKTSFIRAGLLRVLRDRKFGVLYLARPTADPVAAIRDKIATPATEKTYVIVDQFEEFFLSQPARTEIIAFRKSLLQLFGEFDRRLAVVVSIRYEFFAWLQNLAPEIPDPTSPRTTFELQKSAK